jgi:hypothetical protein
MSGSNLSKKTQQLLEILEAHPGEFVDRASIAEALGFKRARLSQEWVVLAEVLAETGRIERTEIPVGKRSIVKVAYRIAQHVAQK